MSSEPPQLDLIMTESYGRLVALLTRRWADLQLAEDAVSEALGLALEKWPRQGTPNNPEAWLFKVANRRAIDMVRRRARGRELEASLPPSAPVAPDSEQLPDERLELILLCCHPALKPQIQAPLALQSVLGVSAERLSSGFALKPATMSARLVRAKHKIRESRIRFQLDPDTLKERVQSTLEALYLAFSLEGDSLGEQTLSTPLRRELLELQTILCQLTQPTPEMLGLQALFCFQLARDQARLDGQGQWIPLDVQDTQRWDRQLIKRGEALLVQAHQHALIGRYQLEAAIESARIHGALRGRPNWDEILFLYQGLNAVAPTLGSRVAWAGALLASGRTDEALNKLKNMDLKAMDQFQPYFATLAGVHRALGNRRPADEAISKAISLSRNASQRAFLESLRHS